MAGGEGARGLAGTLCRQTSTNVEGVRRLKGAGTGASREYVINIYIYIFIIIITHTREGGAPGWRGGESSTYSLWPFRYRCFSRRRCSTFVSE